MKIVTLAVIAASLLLAQDKKAPARGSAAQAAASAPTLPSGAKEVEPGLYRYTDAQGKTWLYRNTPFGLAKWEDKPAASTAPVPPPPAVAVTTTDLGDSVQFVRQTPFGPQKWTKKKTELTETEKEYLQKDDSKQGKPQPSRNAEKPSANAEKPSANAEKPAICLPEKSTAWPPEKPSAWLSEKPSTQLLVGQPIQAADPLSSGSSRLKAGCRQDCLPHEGIA
jgi:hypothetical protein